MAAAIVRLELLSRGEADPVAMQQEGDELRARMDALDAWEDAQPGGRGYQGPRGTAPYAPRRARASED